MTKYDLWDKFFKLAQDNKTTDIKMTDEELILLCNISGNPMMWNMVWQSNTNNGALDGTLEFTTFQGETSDEIVNFYDLTDIRVLLIEEEARCN